MSDVSQLGVSKIVRTEQGWCTSYELTLFAHDVKRMDREHLQMIQDGLCLISEGLAGKTDGPQ